MEIQLIFTQNNKLKIKIISDQYFHGDFKICFSLVYSIKDISGATILNKVGRYYELHSQQDEIFITLQEPRIGSYNLSCGPEGLFILDKNENKIDCKIIPLQFENPIDKIIYSDEQEKNFVPIIPLPQKLSLQKETVQLNSLDFKIPSGEKVFFENFNNFLKSSKINFKVSKFLND